MIPREHVSHGTSSITRFALAIVVIAVLPVAYFVIIDLVNGPSSGSEVGVLSQSATSGAIARSGHRVHPGQGRGPKEIPPPFRTTTTAERSDQDQSNSSGSPTSPSSTVASTTSTSTPPSTETTGPNVVRTLTGAICPCTVDSTVELKGDVSLRGDLMVVGGGTLVARPGVTVDGNGHQIMFMDGGRADVQGTEVFTWSAHGTNQNLSRDISFVNMRRIMFHKGAGQSTLRYFAVKDSGTSALGDYPMHWHLNGDSTRGTLVEGVVVVGGKHHAFVPHGSHGITFRKVIAKGTAGDAFWWDPPCSNDPCEGPLDRRFSTTDNSNDISIESALVDGVSPSAGNDSVAGMQLGAGSGNSVRNSSVINVTGGLNCAGFKWPESANNNIGGTVWVFENNYSSNPGSCHGTFVWQNDFSPVHPIMGFSGDGIDHGAYVNHYHYQNVEVPYFEIHAVGWTGQDSDFGDVIVRKHSANGVVELSNVRMSSLTVDDRGGHPVILEIAGTNIGCGQISWIDPHPETEVWIEGKLCKS